MAFMLTVWAYVARYLGPEQFGLFNYALSFVFLFSILADLGLEPIVVRELVKDGPRENIVLGSSFALKLAGSLIAVFLVVMTTQILSMGSSTRVVLLVMSLRLIFLSPRVLDFYFQSKVLSKYTVYSLLASLVVTAVLCLAFIYQKLPLIYFVWAVILEAVVASVGLLIIYQLKCGNIFSWEVQRREATRLLKDSWPLVISGASIAVYMRIDQIMIKQMLDTASVGYYSSAVRISEAFYFIPMVLTSSLFPAIVNAKMKNKELYQERLKKLFALLFWAAVVISIFLSLAAKPIVRILYGPEYFPAANVLIIHIWASIFVFLGVGMSKWMISENLQIYYMWNTVWGAVVNIVLNLCWIPRYGILGTAAATVFSQCVVSTLANLFNKKTREIFFLQMSVFQLNHLSLRRVR